MTEDSVVALHHPGVTADPLTAVLRAGARELLAQAIEAEVAAVLAAHEHLKTEDGRRRLVRHGHGPERFDPDWHWSCVCAAPEGPGPWQPEESASVSRRPFCPVSRGGRGRWMRFCRRSTFVACPAGTSRRPGGVLEGRLGLSAQVIGRLKAEWEAEHERWRRRDLSARRYVYMWADGIYLQGRLEDEKQCGGWKRRRDARNSWASRRGCAKRPELA